MFTVTCMVCNEFLKEHKPNWGAGHLKKHPDHREYLIAPK